MSYRKTHVKSRVKRVRPKKSCFRRLWFWVIVLCVLLTLSAIYFVLFYSSFQVNNIVISGNQKISSPDIQNIASEEVYKEFFSFSGLKIASRSIFLVRAGKIVNQILEKFPAIERVRIRKEMFQLLAIDISERAPVAIFCPINEALENDVCYFMDNAGVVFEPVDELPNNRIIVRQNIGGSRLVAGGVVVQKDSMDLLLKLEKNMRDDFKIKIKEATITSPIKLSVTTGEGWKIYFNLGDDSDTSVELAKLNLLLNGGMTAQERENLRYIDLKPKDRAIICDNSTCAR